MYIRFPSIYDKICQITPYYYRLNWAFSLVATKNKSYCSNLNLLGVICGAYKTLATIAASKLSFSLIWKVFSGGARERVPTSEGVNVDVAIVSVGSCCFFFIELLEAMGVRNLEVIFG